VRGKKIVIKIKMIGCDYIEKSINFAFIHITFT